MKKPVFALALLAALGLVIVACDKDDKKDACEKAADVMKKGMDEYCGGKSDQCWTCDCYNRSLQLDVTVDGTEIAFSCVTPDPAPETTCDGSALDAAQNCLDNTAQCQASAAGSIESGCDNTAK